MPKSKARCPRRFSKVTEYVTLHEINPEILTPTVTRIALNPASALIHTALLDTTEIISLVYLGRKNWKAVTG